MQATRKLKQHLQANGSVEVILAVKDDPYTFVSLAAGWGGERYAAVGFSKRNPLDAPDPDLGYRIAYGRALTDIARTIAGEAAT